MARQRTQTRRFYVNLWIEIAIRVVLFVAFIVLEKLPPFVRKIHPDEYWLYSNPKTTSYVPSSLLWPTVLSVPAVIFSLHFLATRNRLDFVQASLSLTLALGLNGILTDVLKLSVGRPRPDFIERCFPNQSVSDLMNCTGEDTDVMDGRKSFPSGHSSFSFASMSFVMWYLLGKLHVFNERGRGESWRLMVAVSPMFVALGIAVSRTCDYHHHWQDVAFGSLIGTCLSYICYRQYYPALGAKIPHRSFAEAAVRKITEVEKISPSASPGSEQEGKSFLEDEKETKWI